MHQAMLSFNSGEVTPYLRHRIDFDKTSASAELMENLIAMPYGAVVKRPGLKYVAATATAGVHSKAFPFISSAGVQYIIHFAGYVQGSVAGTIKIIRAADGTVAATLTDSGVVDPAFLWASTAWPLRTLQMLAINDVMFFTHANLHPFQIRHLSDTDWKLEWVPFTHPPMLDANIDENLFLYISTAAMAPAAWATGTVYPTGTVVTHAAATYTCKVRHTSLTTTREPPNSTYWTAGDTGPPAWITGTLYDAGDMVTHATVQWLCTTDIGGGAEKDNPPDSAVASGFWTVRTQLAAKGSAVTVTATGTPLWVNGTVHVVGDVVYESGIKYVAIAAHTAATATNKPGSGSGWAACWESKGAIFPQFTASKQFPGEYLEVWVNHPNKLGVKLTDPGTSDSVLVSDNWTFTTFGTWDGSFQLQTSADNGVTWKTLRTYEGNENRNVSDAGTNDTPLLMRFIYAENSAGTNDMAILTPDQPYVRSWILCTGWTSASVITGTLLAHSLCGRADQFSKSAFTVNHGFPKAVCLHEARLCYGGTTGHPVSVWLSRSNDFLNFAVGANADHAVFATLATGLQAPIQWMVSQRRLFIGTSLGEWVAGSETNDAPLTPSNFIVRQYAANGSIPLQPLLVGPAILFAGRAGGRLLEMSYASDTEVYDTADLSRLGEHLTHPGIQSMAWQQTREPGMWLVRVDGVLLHFAYSRAEKFYAWSQHNTSGGLFRDVVIFPTDDGDDDVFFIVDRGANSLLERFPQNWQAAFETGTGVIPWFHLDGHSGSGTAIDVPTHLQNVALTKLIILESTPTAIPTVSLAQTFTGATSDLPGTTDHYHWQIGYPVTSRLTSLPIDTQAQDGTTQARRKRTHKLLLSLYRSRGGYVWNTLEARKQAIVNTQPTAILRTGWEETIPDAGHLDDLQLHILHDEPWPFCLRCAVMRWKIHEA